MRQPGPPPPRTASCARIQTTHYPYHTPNTTNTSSDRDHGIACPHPSWDTSTDRDQRRSPPRCAPPRQHARTQTRARIIYTLWVGYTTWNTTHPRASKGPRPRRTWAHGRRTRALRDLEISPRFRGRYFSTAPSRAPTCRWTTTASASAALRRARRRRRGVRVYIYTHTHIYIRTRCFSGPRARACDGARTTPHRHRHRNRPRSEGVATGKMPRARMTRRARRATRRMRRRDRDRIRARECASSVQVRTHRRTSRRGRGRARRGRARARIRVDARGNVTLAPRRTRGRRCA